MFTPPKDPSVAMYFIYALSALLLLYAVYRSLFTRLVTPEDYIKRANNYVSYFRSYNKAIQVLEKGLMLPDLKEEEKQEIHFHLGIQHHRLRDFATAAKHFDHVLPRIKKKKLEYSKGYLDMIMSYYNDGQEGVARGLYHQLLKKQHIDPRFGFVTSLDNRIFKEARKK